MRRFILASLLLLSAVRFATAGDAIWSALVLATNEAKPEAPPPELARFAPRLKHVFGYNQFRLIGSHTEILDDPSEHWLIPSKVFCLKVSEEKRGKGRHLLDIALYQKERTLVTTRAELGDESPLFVRGPQFGEGQLLIVLCVK